MPAKPPSTSEPYPTDLGGVCGLASVLLCLALGDYELKYLKGTTGHAWNAFPFPCREKEMIVDITATQFRHDLILLRSGVYLGARPQSFHRLSEYNDKAFKRGHEFLQYMLFDDWYAEPRLGATPGEIRRWKRALRELSRAKEDVTCPKSRSSSIRS